MRLGHKSNLVLIATALCCLSKFSQAQSIAHHIQIIKGSLSEEPKLIGGFHNRYTFVRTQKIVQRGIIVGLDYGGMLKFHCGYYGFSRVNNTQLENDSDWPQNKIVNRKLGLGYAAVGAEYTFKKIDKWQFSSPVELGFGRAKYIYSDENYNLLGVKEYSGMPLSSGVNVYYEILPVFGLKGGAGYRIFLGKKEFRQLTAPYFTFGFNLRIGQMLKQLK